MMQAGKMLVTCPDCGRREKLSLRLFGQIMTCPECGKQMEWKGDSEVITKGEYGED